jgi:pyrroloquinoline quinone biosynthesis protein E
VTPRLSRGCRVRPDPRDGAPVLLSPERGLRLSQTAAEVIGLCDGRRRVGDIVDALVLRYAAADAGRIGTDVAALLGALRERGVIEWSDAGVSGGSPSAAGATDGGLRDPTERETLSSTAPVAAGADAPYTLIAELTHRCALACPYCSNPLDLVAGHDELTTDEWRGVLDDAALLGVMQVHLSGGEPLARADLGAVAAHARSRGLYVNLVTSGVPLSRARLEALAPSLDHVQLSVQDASAQRSDRVAGTASFEQKVRVAAWVKELGLPLTLNVVIHRQNIERVADVIAMAERLGADRLELANVQLVSWALANRAALLPSRVQIDSARAVAAAAKRRLDGRMQIIFVLPDWHADRPRACMDGWGRRFAVVAPDGAVLPCHAARALPLTFEGIRERPLSVIWREGGALRAFRGEGWMVEPCRSCDRRAVDFGGCRCQAFALTGDAAQTDPACSLSPHHGLIRAAREAGGGREAREEGDPTEGGAPLVFRGRADPRLHLRQR